MRIVSLLPSATEILFALGLGDQVVGVTFECDYPPAARTSRVVSNTAMPEGLTPAEIDRVVKERMAAGEDLYRLERDALADLDPDLVVTQDLCEVCAVATSNVDEALEVLGIDADVLTLDPPRLEDVIDSIAIVAAATGTESTAIDLSASLHRRLDDLAQRLDGAPRPRVAVLEWTAPPFASGHWVPDLIAAAGGDEVLGTPGGRSVEVTWRELATAAPDVVIVAPCGYRLDGATELAESLVGEGMLPDDVAVWAVDADAFVVRPGPRVVDGAEIFASLLHAGRGLPVDPARARRIN
ncbi:MAG: cobalamin-binding protein [Actinomycetota bacterium]